MSEPLQLPITHRTDTASRSPCVIHEDEHLLVVNKPAGWNTHAPSPYAGEGIYDWLRHREPRWANLAIIHRLDKETSGVMVFGKTPLANRSLTEQFEQRTIRKKYVLLTDHMTKSGQCVVKSKISRAGERYVSGPRGEPAETKFTVPSGDRSPHLIMAEPFTGRTHQIRVHAAESGFPILGDKLYGGSAFPRVCLHAAELQLRHPATGVAMSFAAPVDFEADARLALRAAVVESNATNAFRVVHGTSDGWPGWHVEKLGDYLLSQSESELTEPQRAELARLMEHFPARGVYHKILTRQVRRTSVASASPQHVMGEVAPERFSIRENSVSYELSFAEGYSVGLFLDQCDNRRRLLTGHIAADFQFRVPGSEFRVLNTFAYTCGFSVCAAKGGANLTSLDLSKKYLEWGKRNFALNGLNAAAHDFIFGDTFDWLKRFAKKERKFDCIILDPPTFSQSKEHGIFRAEKDFGKLVAASLPVLATDGVLLASSNAADWKPEEFLATIVAAVSKAGRKIVQRHYAPQPPDFPVSRAESAYLKTAWFRVR